MLKKLKKFVSTFEAIWKHTPKDSLVMGKSYFFEEPDKKMTPSVDTLAYNVQERVYFNHKISGKPWIIRKERTNER